MAAAELCGLPAPEYLSGVSLAPVLNDPSARPRTSAFTQHASGYSIRTERYRYTEWGEDGKDGAELYDHRADSREIVNLAKRPQHADTVGRLSKRLRQRIVEARRAPQGVEQIHFDHRRRAK